MTIVYSDTTQIDPNMINTVQPLRFVLGNPQAAHVSGESTFDEYGHILSFNNDAVSGRGRGLQQIYIRQGDAQGFSYPMYFYDGTTGQLADLTGNKVILFEGQSADGPWFITPDTFDVTQADQGLITWQPSEQVAQYAGYFKSAHILIESEDRSQRLATLDFGIYVVPNDIPIPSKLAPVLTEYHRVLQQSYDIGQTIDAQNKYMLSFVSTLVNKLVSSTNDQIAQLVAAVQKKVDQAITDQNTKLDQVNTNMQAAQKLIDGLNDGLTQLQTKETAYEQSLNDQIANWTQQLSDKNLITKDQITALVATAVDDLANAGTINFDDSINDQNTKSKIQKLAGVK